MSECRKPGGQAHDVEYFRARSEPDTNGGCWLWVNALNNGGYGAVRIPGGNRSAHRLCFEVANDVTVPRGIDVCHRCDVRACVNPDHLFAGTRTDNMRDCANKGRIRVPTLSGDVSPNSKLSSRQVLAIRADTRSNREIARDLGVDKGTIASIRRGHTWRSV